MPKTHLMMRSANAPSTPMSPVQNAGLFSLTFQLIMSCTFLSQSEAAHLMMSACTFAAEYTPPFQ